MIDIGVTKLAIIGGIALVVIGPEKLPGLAKTIGTLLGRARRYVADVKAEVSRSMELDELKKMKDTVESAARDVENTIQTNANAFEKDWNDTTGLLSYWRLGETSGSSASDTFTGTAGTVLQNHTGEIGATWAKPVGSSSDSTPTSGEPSSRRRCSGGMSRRATSRTPRMTERSSPSTSIHERSRSRESRSQCWRTWRPRYGGVRHFFP